MPKVLKTNYGAIPINIEKLWYNVQRLKVRNEYNSFTY